MGLLNGTIPATSLVDDVIVYNGNTYNSGATGEKWTRIDAECTTISWNASTTFTSSTNKPFNDTTNGILYYVAKPSDATIAISATAGSHLYAWSASGSNTTVNTANTYKSFTIVTPDYSNDFNQKIWKFNYTGSAKQWVVLHTGTYTVECWGASGGASYSNHHDGHAGYGGNGGYVSGKIILESDLTFIAKIGGVGITIANATNSGGGWNGGGGGTNSWDSNQRSAGGGGATDLSITGDVKNRIIVAAGGGGACQHNGAHAGGLIGYTEMTPGQDGYGGKQDAVSSTPSNSGYGTSTSSFGAGGEGKSIGGGGGGGWYGGSGGTRNNGVDGSGGGGSSFISGHPGCNAVNTSTGAHLGTSTMITYGGRVYEFSDTQMIDGTGKEWTTADQTTGGNNIGRPTNPGGSNGYMIITFVPN